MSLILYQHCGDLCILDKFFIVTICVSVLNMSLILYQHCGDLCILDNIFYCNHLCVSSKYEADFVPALWGPVYFRQVFYCNHLCVSSKYESDSVPALWGPVYFRQYFLL